MAANEPQASGSGDSKFNAPAQQEAAQDSIQEQDVEQSAEVKVHPSNVVQTTTTTKNTMDVDGKPTEVQETVTTKPDAKKPEEKKREEEESRPTQKKDKDKTKDKEESAPKQADRDDAPEEVTNKKRHWLLQHLDETMDRFGKKGKPQDFMVGFQFGYETVAAFFIVAEKLFDVFGPKPAEAGITPKQGTVAGLHGKKDGTFKMLENANAGVSANKPAPGQKPTLGTQIKNTAQGIKQGAQEARRSAAPGRKM